MHTYTHAYIHMHYAHLAPGTLERKRLISPPTQHGTSHTVGWGRGSFPCEGLTTIAGLPFPLHTQITSFPAPDLITLDVWKSSPEVVKAVSLLMHSPLLSIYLFHVQSYFLVPQVFLSPQLHIILPPSSPPPTNLHVHCLP